MGDLNLDFLQWSTLCPSQRDMVESVKQFMANVSMEQVEDQPTRLATLGGDLVKTLLDHCYVTLPQSYSTPRVVTVGDSDHQGKMISQLAWKTPTKPSTIKVSVFNQKSTQAFMQDLLDSNVNNQFIQESLLSDADKVYNREQQYVANK